MFLLFRGRLSDYDSLVQLGARIGAKIRERDEHEKGSLHRNKVCHLKQYQNCINHCIS